MNTLYQILKAPFHIIRLLGKLQMIVAITFVGLSLVYGLISFLIALFQVNFLGYPMATLWSSCNIAGQGVVIGLCAAFFQEGYVIVNFLNNAAGSNLICWVMLTSPVWMIIGLAVLRANRRA